jgi:hypothetical protein
MGLALWASTALGESPAAPPDPMQLIYNCREAYKSVKDFTAVIHRTERVGAKVGPRETIRMKFRNQPFSVYMKWVAEPHRTRELIYVEKQNDGLIVAHEVVGFLNIMRRVSPNAPEAHTASRHPITEAGFGKAIETLIGVCETAKKVGDLKLLYAGQDSCDNRPTDLLIRMLPQKAGYPYNVIFLHIDRQLSLPVKFISLNWSYELEAVFEYTGLKLNVGLTDKDFSYRNPEYSFPGAIPLAKPRIPWFSY